MTSITSTKAWTELSPIAREVLDSDGNYGVFIMRVDLDTWQPSLIERVWDQALRTWAPDQKVLAHQAAASSPAALPPTK